MTRASRFFIFSGAAMAAIMLALSLLGQLNETAGQVLARKVLTSFAFIVIGVGFLLHREKAWKILGAAAIAVNGMIIWLWYSLRDFM
jgi:hypothetical protein